MIDLHCHILPRVDAGALDLADSVGMARQADADGVALICATPHIRHDHDVRIAEPPRRAKQPCAEAARRAASADPPGSANQRSSAATTLPVRRVRVFHTASRPWGS